MPIRMNSWNKTFFRSSERLDFSPPFSQHSKHYNYTREITRYLNVINVIRINETKTSQSSSLKREKERGREGRGREGEGRGEREREREREGKAEKERQTGSERGKDRGKEGDEESESTRISAVICSQSIYMYVQNWSLPMVLKKN